MGEFFTLMVPLTGEGLALNLDSNLLGREIGLGILDLPELPGLRLMVFEIEQLEQLECVWEWAPQCPPAVPKLPLEQQVEAGDETE